jgi:hypothetical protein
MRNFRCACGNTVYFENSQCLACGRALGFLPERLTISALEPLADDQFRAMADGGHYRQCRNYREQKVCNWMIAADDPNGYCLACRLNHRIPNLSDPRSRVLWARIEQAKRRLLYTLFMLRLPVVGRDVDAAHGLAFEFLADAPPETEFSDDTGNRRVLTGHLAGLITINIAEADPSARESMREKMGEQYRTLLGHFRHETAHFYWDRLVRDSDWIEPFRALFDDERADYAAALRRHYDDGPRTGWQDSCVSAYASAHPWEDWAETWSHYLHMVDTLETAQDYGFAAGRVPRRFERAGGGQLAAAPDTAASSFDELLAQWVPLTLALNALNRSMGLPDAYPFALSARAVEKLWFVHRVIATAG